MGQPTKTPIEESPLWLPLLASYYERTRALQQRVEALEQRIDALQKKIAQSKEIKKDNEIDSSE